MWNTPFLLTCLFIDIHSFLTFSGEFSLEFYIDVSFVHYFSAAKNKVKWFKDIVGVWNSHQVNRFNKLAEFFSVFEPFHSGERCKYSLWCCQSRDGLWRHVILVLRNTGFTIMMIMSNFRFHAGTQERMAALVDAAHGMEWLQHVPSARNSNVPCTPAWVTCNRGWWRSRGS